MKDENGIETSEWEIASINKMISYGFGYLIVITY